MPDYNGCERMVGPEGRRRRCRRPGRYVFEGRTGFRLDLPMRKVYCVLHSGPGLLSEGALPGWVESVTDLKKEK